VNWIQKTIDIIELIFSWISRICVMILMLLITSDTIARYFFQKSIPGVYEITQEYLMIGIVFLSLSFVYVQGDHVKVEILSRFIKGRARQILEILNDLGGITFFSILLYAGWGSAITALQMDVVSNSQLAYPIAPALFLVAIGSFLMVLRLIGSLITNICSKNSFYQEETYFDTRG
jgi:TRAP-type C4-dicarboxylate transport system permease small subunit